MNSNGECAIWIYMLRKYIFHDGAQFTQIYQNLFSHLFTGHLFASSKTKAIGGHFVHTWRSLFGKWYFESLLIASAEPWLFVFRFHSLQFLKIWIFKLKWILMLKITPYRNLSFVCVKNWFLIETNLYF